MARDTSTSRWGDTTTRFIRFSRYWLLIILLISLLMLLIPASAVEADSVVNFADPNLELAVRLHLFKPSGDIYESDLVGLTHLFAPAFGITNLAGLEYCTSLTSLILSSNEVSDITPLAGLTNLTILELSHNQISDITPLTGLTNLTTLELSYNQISDITPLTGLTNLTTLELRHNQISDIVPLAELSSLMLLNLQENQVSDITPLVGLTNLTSLNLDDNQISDITPLTPLIGLITLGLSNNQISDITPLASLAVVLTLTLSKNQISDITPLAGLANLTSLDLDDNQIGDITALADLTLSTSLTLSKNQISDITPLAGLTLLPLLDLGHNQISDTTPLTKLTYLTSLNLDDNQISDVEPLVDNTGMGSGDTVYLRSDPLSNTSKYTWIPALLDRGVKVYWDAPGNQSPIQPNNVSPEDADTEVSLTPTLVATAFSDPDGDDHEASQWQIRTALGDYSSGLVFDSNWDHTDLTSITVPTLSYSTTYYWRVRYRDSRLFPPSFWSDETSFTTGPTCPLVTTSGPGNITTESARLNGDLTWFGTASSVTVSFEWGTSSASYPNETAGEVKTGTGPFFFDLSGLSPGTTYYYRAKAIGNGTAYGDEESFTTTTMAPAVTTSDASNLAATSATLNGYLDNLGTAASVVVSFEWRVSGGSYTPIAAGVNYGIGPFSIALTGLTPEDTYYFRAKAVGDGTIYGTEKSFSTLPPSPLVITNDPSSVTINSARLNGNLASLGTAGNVTVSFEWGTTLGGSYLHETTGEIKTSTGAFYFDLHGLSPGTTYYYRAKAIGNGTRYGEEKSLTPATTPPTVTTNDASNLAATSAILNGHLDNLGTASGVDVSFEWGLTTSCSNETTLEPRDMNGSFSFNLTGLDAGTTYFFRAKAVGHGTSYGAEESFTTLPTFPLVVTNDPSSITTESARLSGDLTWLGTASSASVSFVWGTSSQSYTNGTTGQDMTSTGAFYFDLSSLSPGTTYYYRAKAVGNGTSYGDEKSLTTGQRPMVEDADPGGGRRAQHLTVTVIGANFFGATKVSFGSGIAVEDFDVNSSSEIVARIIIAGDAVLGARDVSVTTGWGTGTKEDGFSVAGGGAQPHWIWVAVGTSGALAASIVTYFVARRRRII